MSTAYQYPVRTRDHWDAGAWRALMRMGRARQRGTGCHLTADEIKSLSLTFIGSAMSEAANRKIPLAQKP